MPVAPPLAECETCDARHEVILGRPCISVGRVQGVGSTIGGRIVGPVIIKFGNAHEGTLVSESFDPETGLVTLVFEDTFRGNPEKWLIPGTGVVALDAGFISWTVTVVIDTTTDELVSEDFTDVVIHGPHPIFENDFSLSPEQLATVCNALGA